MFLSLRSLELQVILFVKQEMSIYQQFSQEKLQNLVYTFTKSLAVANQAHIWKTVSLLIIYQNSGITSSKSKRIERETKQSGASYTCTELAYKGTYLQAQ